MLNFIRDYGSLISLSVALAYLGGGGTPNPVSPAWAHSWFKGAKDPVHGWECCNDKDCGAISDTDLMQVAGGWIYLPFDNKKGPNDSNPGFVSNDRIQYSTDFSYAVCIGGSGGTFPIPYGSAPVQQMFVRCLFIPGNF